MTDTFSQAKRTMIMRSIRSRGNKSTEQTMVSFFKKEKITGWRRNYKLFGKPDFVFPKKRIVLFVDGCFWHGCSEHCRIPQTNTEYWTQKIKKNKIRDEFVRKSLVNKGWTVIRIWEHQLKRKNWQDTAAYLKQILSKHNLKL